MLEDQCQVLSVSDILPRRIEAGIHAEGSKVTTQAAAPQEATSTTQLAAPLAFLQWEIMNYTLWHDHGVFIILLARNMNNIRHLSRWDRNLFHWIRPIRHLMCHYENINQMSLIFIVICEFNLNTPLKLHKKIAYVPI